MTSQQSPTSLCWPIYYQQYCAAIQQKIIRIYDSAENIGFSDKYAGFQLRHFCPKNKDIYSYNLDRNSGKIGGFQIQK